MIIDVKVPQLSESVAEATLVTWHKQVGEAVSRDENLIDIETDKVVLELPASASGVLAEIIKQNGDTVVAGELIARIDTEGTATVATSAPPAKAAPAAPPAHKTHSGSVSPSLCACVGVSERVSPAASGNSAPTVDRRPSLAS